MSKALVLDPAHCAMQDLTQWELEKKRQTAFPACRKGKSGKTTSEKMWMLCCLTPFLSPQVSRWDPAGWALGQFPNCPTRKRFCAKPWWRWRSRRGGSWLRSCASRPCEPPPSGPLPRACGGSRSCSGRCWPRGRRGRCSTPSSPRGPCAGGQLPAGRPGAARPRSPCAGQES